MNVSFYFFFIFIFLCSYEFSLINSIEKIHSGGPISIGTCGLEDQATDQTNRWLRKFHYNNQNFNLRIEVTNRASHRIVSYILAILLKEKLRYEDVEFVEEKWQNPYDSLNRMTCNKDPCEKPPMSFINMELWLAPGFNLESWVNRGAVIDCGPLGPITQLGVFTHQSIVDQMMKQTGIALDHYRTIQNSYLRQKVFETTTTATGTSGTSTTTASASQGNLPKNLYFNATHVDNSQCNAKDNATNKCINFYLDRPELLEPLRKLMSSIFPSTPYRLHVGNQTALMKWLHPSGRKNVNRYRRSSSSSSTAFDSKSNTQQNAGQFPFSSSSSSSSATLSVMDYFVDWYPSTLTVLGNYSLLFLPDSYTSADEHSHNGADGVGNFTVYQPTKVVWQQLKQHSEQAFQLVDRMKFSQAEYKYLLSRVTIRESSLDMDKEYHAIACQWLKDNKQRWQSWIEGYNKKKVLYIGGLFALEQGKLSSSSLLPAAISAIKDLNFHNFSKTEYDIRLDIRNLSCSQDKALDNYIALSNSCDSSKSVIGIVAALCSSSLEAMIKLADRQRKIIMSSTVESAKFLLTRPYPFFFRTSPSRRYYSQLLVDLFGIYKWRRVVLLRKDDDYIDKATFKDNNIDILDDFESPEEGLSFDKVYEFLRATRDNLAGRIFIVEFSPNATSIILCAAAKLGMTFDNSYVWFVNQGLTVNWNTTNSRPTNCSEKEMSKALYGHFYLQHYALESARAISLEEQQQNKRFDRLRSMMAPPGIISSTPTPGISSSPYSLPFAQASTYDAVYALGDGILRLLLQHPSAISALSSDNMSDAFRETVALTNLSKIPAHGSKYRTTISFNKDNEMDSSMWALRQFAGVFINTWVWSHINGSQNLNILGKLVEVKLGQNGSVTWYRSVVASVIWSIHGIPDDGGPSLNATCSLRFIANFFNTSCSAATAILCGSTTFISIVIVAIVIFTCSRRLRSYAYNYKKPFDELRKELHTININADDIKLNQKRMGKGAFGDVHCATLRDVDGKLKNAAVKMINSNSTLEVQVDFLNEAKVMKQLDHPCVVKIYGMCFDVPEKIYLVMELMNWGDLKSFLLSRRTKCLTSEAVEVSPKSLTKFMIDAAEGLGYMHSKNFIHRDVASRNCLITEQNSEFKVKVSDFGLARLLQGDENDRYYQFKKKAEVPIRWMSPQDLNFGRSNMHSDVWSFGVLLYEVVTFGAFPYDELLDEAVSDRVVRNQLSILNCLPKDAAGTELFNLIQWCSQYEPENRPKNMQEIIDYLHDHEDVVRPYLFDDPPRMRPHPRSKLISDRSDHAGLTCDELSPNGFISHQKPKTKRSHSKSKLKTSSSTTTDPKTSSRIIANGSSTTISHKHEISFASSKALSTEYLASDNIELSAVSAPDAANDLVYECNGDTIPIHPDLIPPSHHHHYPHSQQQHHPHRHPHSQQHSRIVDDQPVKKSSSLFSVPLWPTLRKKGQQQQQRKKTLHRNNSGIKTTSYSIDKRAGSEGEQVELLTNNSRPCISVGSLAHSSNFLPPTSTDSFKVTIVGGGGGIVGGDIGGTPPPLPPPPSASSPIQLLV